MLTMFIILVSVYVCMEYGGIFKDHSRTKKLYLAALGFYIFVMVVSFILARDFEIGTFEFFS